MEFCDDVYTTSNKIRSLCFFAIFHTGISALEIFSLMCVIYLAFLEFNYSDTHKKTNTKRTQNTPQNEDTHGPNYKSCFSAPLYFVFLLNTHSFLKKLIN